MLQFCRVRALEITVCQKFQIVKLERCIADVFSEMMETQLSFDFSSFEFHVAKFAGCNVIERAAAAGIYKEGVESIVVMSPFDFDVSLVFFLVYEFPFDIDNHG